MALNKARHNQRSAPGLRISAGACRVACRITRSSKEFGLAVVLIVVQLYLNQSIFRFMGQPVGTGGKRWKAEHRLNGKWIWIFVEKAV